MSRAGRVRDLRPGAWGMIAALATMALLFAWKGVPFVRADRQITSSTPTVVSDQTPAALPLRPGADACVRGITIDGDVRVVRIAVAGRAAPPVRMTITAPGGYRAVATGAGGTSPAPGAPILAKVTPPSGGVARATICFRNLGRRTARLVGAAPGRSSSTAVTTVAGRPTDTDLSVSLLVATSGTIAGNAGRILGHLAAFRPVTGWMVGLLALLALLGIPVAIGVAVMRAADEDERSARADAPADA